MVWYAQVRRSFDGYDTIKDFDNNLTRNTKLNRYLLTGIRKDSFFVLTFVSGYRIHNIANTQMYPSHTDIGSELSTYSNNLSAPKKK